MSASVLSAKHFHDEAAAFQRGPRNRGRNGITACRPKRSGNLPAAPERSMPFKSET